MEKMVVPEAAPPLSFSEARLICRVCQKQFSQYTCPRCNTRYCSLECYKRHSLRCTESFMRENVTEELHQIQSNDETKREMLEILKRVHSEESIYSASFAGSMLSEETIQKSLYGDELRIGDLSPDELKKFRRAAANGELSKLIVPWDPWWKKPSASSISLSPAGNQLVRLLHEDKEDVECSTRASDSSVNDIPAGPESPLLSVHQLSRSDPSPLLPVHLIDIIYGYCFALRLYNGDWHFDPLGAATVVLAVSSVLGDDGCPETVSEALASCMERTCSASFRDAGGLKFGLVVIDDAISMLSLGASAIICLLCDLRRLVRAGDATLKSERITRTKRAESGRRLNGVDRKVYFMTCWVHEQPEEVWSPLAGLLEVERVSVSGLGKDSSGAKKGSSKSKFIEEV
ncbi:hypothetical protein KSP40_PGU003850 [Platanthera guangdongensis]|uniref:HIT-type domain-containing protein n=1 Tax=Platanthera guangdongensis TaxID=2320717 RepID=A0ABR2MYL9_9ASPA